MALTKEQAKEEIARLVDKYQKVLDSHNEKSYNEARTKTEFIESLFECLNWDMRNRNIPDEVLPEDKVSRGRADYAFRINGVTRLFIEAKSLKAGIDDIDYAKQTISYGWHKGVTFAVLTDFDSLKVFNCEWNEPNIMRNLVFEMKYTQYVSEFDRLWRLSKDGILTDALGEYAKSIGKRAIRESIFDLLLHEFTDWRETLSKDIVKNHPAKYQEEDVDEIVQRILNRLIFIRMCEDKRIEEGRLWQALTDYKERGKSLVSALQKDIFPYYRKHYDSKLFGISDEDIHETDKVDLSNEAFAHVIERMYYTPDRNIKYDFSIIDADVLGSVYEQYLGHLLKKTPKRAKIEEEYNHRKKQGIYYTPAYIVDYIVRNTLGELINNKKPSEVERIKVLDPACGSGSFLIKVFDVLDEYYSKHDKHYNQSKLDPESEKAIVTRKTNILTDNIYGVDLDTKAVEITQLNLLLKAAEQRHRLPALQNNIKNGNSIIDDPEIGGKKAFKWDEQFKGIMSEGGFDVVVGNPPYFKIFEKDPLNTTVDYQEIKSGMMNASAIFINKSLKLLKNGGYLGMIVPKMLAFTDSWDKIRSKILKNFKILKVVDCGKAFKGVLLEQIIFILKKEPYTDRSQIVIGELNNQIITETAKISQKLCLENNSIYLEPNPTAYRIKDRMEQSKISLGKISKITLGLGIQGKDFFVEEYKTGYEKVLRGDDIQRYFIRGCKFYDPSDERIIKLHNTIEKFKTPHIVAQRIVAHIKDHIKITSAIDKEGLFSFNTVTNIFVTDEKYPLNYVLALLNSNAVQYYTYKFIYNNAIRSMDFYKAYAAKIPLPVYNKDEQDKITKLTIELIGLYGHLNELGDKQTDQRKNIEEEIKKTDAEIDELVYKLYEITDEEKKVIKESLG